MVTIVMVIVKVTCKMGGLPTNFRCLVPASIFDDFCNSFATVGSKTFQLLDRLLYHIPYIFCFVLYFADCTGRYE